MNTAAKWIVGIASALTFIGLGFIFIRKRKPGQAQTTFTAMGTTTNERKISLLHPAVREKAREFMAAAEKQGIVLRITSSLRTFAEQDALYAQGRTDKSKPKVTNAKAGQSSHNYGTAIDVVPIVNGKADYNVPQATWKKIGQIGKSVGFSWGGDWTSFKDMPHFEMNFGKTLAQLKSLYDAGKTKDGYVQLA